MALHTKKDFASLCGIATNNLSVQISRKKVIEKDGFIDDADQINAAFIQKRASKIIIKPEKPAPVKILPAVLQEKETKLPETPLENSENQEKDLSSLSYAQLEKEKKLADLLKTQADTTHRNLQIEKLTGASIPTELVKEVVSNLSKTLISSFKDGADYFLIEIQKQKNLTAVELAELRGALITIINNASSKAITESKKRIKNIVADYSIKREVGEHD